MAHDRFDELDIVVQNNKIRGAIESSIMEMFPIKGKTQTLQLDGIHLDLSKVDELDLPSQKEAKLRGRPWTTPLYGTFSLIDNATNKVVDKIKDKKIGNIPLLTNRFSVILKKGAEYQTINQLRLKPGIYTRMQANGEFESRFNLEKGFNFRLYLDPDKGVFYLNLGNQNYKLYLILHALGVSDPELKKAWGSKIYELNIQQGTQGMENTIVNLYEKLTHDKVDYGRALKGLKQYLDQTKVSEETTKLTLGESFDKVSSETLIATSKKLLRVMRGEEPPDERDSLLFKKLYPLDELMKSYISANIPKISKNLEFRVDSKSSINEMLSSDTFTDPIFNFFNKSELTSTPSQTNPIEMIGEWRKTTLMGTGGIQSSHAITLETRDVHESQFGYLDPINTPESQKIGVTLPLAIGTTRAKGELKTDIRTISGKLQQLTPVEFYSKKIGLPDQYKINNGKFVGKTPKIKAIYQGKIEEIPWEKVDGWIPASSRLFSWTTNLIPFLAHNDGARAMMGSKMVVQALPLKNPDAPLVQNKVGTTTFEEAIGNFPNPVSPFSGTVIKISPDYVTLKEAKTNHLRKIGIFNNFPLNQGTFLHSTPIVKEGDKVNPDDVLAFNNFQKEGTLAVGANVNIAYMPWKGYNFEDSAVITESLADKFTSEHIFKDTITITSKGILNKQKFQAAYPEVLTRDQGAKLDEEGVIKIGETVHPNEVLVAYLETRDLSDDEKILKQMHKHLSNPYVNKSLVYSHMHPGKVLYVNKVGKQLIIYIKTSTPMVVGDKIAGRHGNKMIVSKIISDDEAPHTLDGQRVDLMTNPHGVPGRMNIGQLLETAYGRLAKKSGKVIKIDNFSGENHLTLLKDAFKQSGLQFNEILLDGKNGKPFENPIFIGNQYMMKLKHVVDHKLKARDYGSYTVDQQPGKGDQSGQKLDPLTTYAMLAHGAKQNLYEATSIKGQKNDEIWRALQLGQPLPPPKVNFVFDKLLTYLKAAGVDTQKEGHKLRLAPFLDKDIKKLSGGELVDAGHVLTGKNLAVIKGGLFDEAITGGLNGKKWSHIKLEARMPHPIFENAIISILGLTKPQFENIMNERIKDENGLTGAEKIEHDLKSINTDEAIKQAKRELAEASPLKVNALNKKIRYLQALKENGLTPDNYIIEYFPIMPPIFRPTYSLPTGAIINSPINNNYRRLALINQNSVKTYKDLGPEAYKIFGPKARADLYKALKETVGLVDVAEAGSSRKYEGLLKTLTGNNPKEGFVQNKAWSKRQDLSARSTITLEPSLGLDNVGIPYAMAKVIFKPFAMQELVHQGYSPLKAVEEFKNETNLAKRALTLAMEKRPVILNRAPSLHKHGVQAFKPILFPGKSIRLNPLVVSGFNADFDGDTMSVHVPVTTKAVEEAFGMVPSKNVFGAGRKINVPVESFSQDYMLGLWHLTRNQNKTNKIFDTIKEAKAAGLKMGDEFELKGIGPTTLGRITVNEVLPDKYKDYSLVITHKVLNSLMDKIALEAPNDYSTVLDSLKDLGNQYGHTYGATASLTDLDVDNTYRDKMITEAKKHLDSKWDAQKKAQYWQKITDQIQKKTFEDLAKKGNNSFLYMLQSGAIGSGKASNVAQIMTLLGVKTDVKNVPLERPFLKSWTEGLDVGDYWENMYSARKGIVDRSIKTADSGALNKSLLGATKDLLVTDDDCETIDGIKMDINSPDIYDRFLAQTVPGVGKHNDLIDSALISRARSHQIMELIVRSPLTCKEPNGVCQLCYGLMADGKLPSLGTNVGIIDGQAVTERSTQLTLQTFHTGGRVDTGITAKFPRLVQLLQVPKTVRGKAVLAEKSGTVTKITKNPTGGWIVVIGQKEHRVPAGRELLVKEGEDIEIGDSISTGVVKPQELASLKDFRSAQLQMVNDLSNLFDNKFHKRTFETVIRGISNNAEITEAPEGSGYLRGDLARISELEKINEERTRKQQPLISFTPYFRSISMLPGDKQDWLSRLTTERLKQTITEGAATGMATNIKGNDPLPAYIYGLDFGKDFNPKKGQFY